MIHFNNRPDSSTLRIPLKVVRTRPRQPLTVVHLCQTFVGVDTHWWGGKTVPHTDESCTPCDRAVPLVWKGFVPIAPVADQGRRGLLQITPLVVNQLNDEMMSKDGICGLVARYSRFGNRINSPLTIEILERIKPPTVYSEDRVKAIVAALFRAKTIDDSTLLTK